MKAPCGWARTAEALCGSPSGRRSTGIGGCQTAATIATQQITCPPHIRTARVISGRAVKGSSTGSTGKPDSILLTRWAAFAAGSRKPTSLRLWKIVRATSRSDHNAEDSTACDPAQDNEQTL